MAGDSNKSQTGPPKAVSFGANGQVNGDSGDQDARALRRSSTGVQGLKHRTFSSNELRDCDFSERKDDALRLHRTIEDMAAEQEAQRISSHSGGSLLQDLLNISPIVTDAAAAVVDDSFLRCFQGAPPDPWNWNVYLFPTWCLGCLIRFGILFPLRLIMLLLGFLLFFIAFFGTRAVLKPGLRRSHIERALVQWQCWIFVASWTGVIRYHGPRPAARENAVWVCNHTSMIDYIILTAYSPFAVIMQLHPGWVGFVQTAVLGCLGCLWFNRNEVRDRQLVAGRMRKHVADATSTPLLIFPEGTCVNNEFCVMFKRGAFDLGAAVFPIAIRYNKIFVDAFWNSKKQSFTAHLLKLMTSWAVVCDVYFLPPQTRRDDETAQQFAERCQALIAAKAKLKIAPWDGYLKYYNLGAKHPDLIEKRRRVFADNLRRYARPAAGLPSGAAGSGDVEGASPATYQPAAADVIAADAAAESAAADRAISGREGEADGAGGGKKTR